MLFFTKNTISGIVKDECAPRNWFVQFFEGSIELTLPEGKKREKDREGKGEEGEGLDEGEKKGEEEKQPCYASTGEITREGLLFFLIFFLIFFFLIFFFFDFF